MKLTKETQTILSNFASINQNIVIDANTPVLKTVNQQETVFATAEIDETFPNEVGIYDLTELLNVLGLSDLSKTEIDFGKENITVSTDDGYHCQYNYASKKVLKYPEKMIKMPESFLSFVLESDVLQKLRKAAQVLSKPSISFVGDSSSKSPGSIIVSVMDGSNVTGNSFSTTISHSSDLSNVESFEFIFSLTNLRYLLANEDYQVSFAAKGQAKISEFATLEDSAYNVKYYIGLDSSSKVVSQ